LDSRFVSLAKKVEKKISVKVFQAQGNKSEPNMHRDIFFRNVQEESFIQDLLVYRGFSPFFTREGS